MGSTSRYGRASINPSDPRAVGTCDRCGFLYNLNQLQFQFDWAGAGMINKQVRVCKTCMDIPQQQLRTITLPPDPRPVWQPRVENYFVDEMNDYTLRAAAIGRPMFLGVGSLTVALELVTSDTFAAHMSGTSSVLAILARGVTAAATVSSVSDLTVTLTQEGPAAAVTAISASVITDTGDPVEAPVFTPGDSTRLVAILMGIDDGTDTRTISTVVDDEIGAWTLVQSAGAHDDPFVGLHMYTRTVTTGVPLTVLGNFVAGVSAKQLQIFELHGLNGTPGVKVGNNAIGYTTGDMTLPGSAVVTSVVIAARALVIDDGETAAATPGFGWTELFDQTTADRGGAETQWRSSSTSTAVAWTSVNSASASTGLGCVGVASEFTV